MGLEPSWHVFRLPLVWREKRILITRREAFDVRSHAHQISTPAPTSSFLMKRGGFLFSGRKKFNILIFDLRTTLRRFKRLR